MTIFERRKKIALLMFFLWTVVCGLWTGCAVLVAEAAVPHLISYQGRLTDASGNPLTGSYAVTFRIYDAETAGSMLWEETHLGVVVEKGLFSVFLGGVAALNVTFDRPYFLEIKVGTEVMTPRQKVTSAAYALRSEKAENADAVGGMASSSFAVASDITATPTANKAVRMDSGGKLPLSALKVYDSGWFAVSAGGEYWKIHNLGTEKVMYVIWFEPSSAPGNRRQLSAGWGSIATSGYGTFIEGLSATQIGLQIGGSGCGGLDNNGTTAAYPSGNVRIIMLALE